MTDYLPPARRTDPVTSHVAGKDRRPKAIAKGRDSFVVLEWFVFNGGVTQLKAAEEIAADAVARRNAFRSEQTYRKRVSDLKYLGLVEVFGRQSDPVGELLRVTAKGRAVYTSVEVSGNTWHEYDDITYPARASDHVRRPIVRRGPGRFLSLAPIQVPDERWIDRGRVRRPRRQRPARRDP